jgi:hypothetical protein
MMGFPNLNLASNTIEYRDMFNFQGLKDVAASSGSCVHLILPLRSRQP